METDSQKDLQRDLQSQVAFFLSGQASAPQLTTIESMALRPALFAAYQDLHRLRHDFPLLLVDDAADGAGIVPLSAVVDEILGKIALGERGGRIRQHVLHLEMQLRKTTAGGKSGRLSALWDKAAQVLGRKDAALADSLALARANLRHDGELIDCDARTPARVVEHAWSRAQAQRARRFAALKERLDIRLSEILQADFANSQAGRSAANLRRTFGSGPLDRFDFEAMARLLNTGPQRASLGEARRKRIEALLASLRTQSFFPLPTTAKAGRRATPQAFVFASCRTALDAYRRQLPEAIAVARALAVAELEVRGEYDEARHDRLFAAFGEDGLDPREAQIFPDMLVRTHATRCDADELDALAEILALNLPIKILVQTDDVIEPSPLAHGHLAFAPRSRQLAQTALGVDGVFVMQAPAAALYPLAGAIARGFAHPGPSLFSIFSGATPGRGQVPPYLISAAALEARAFPAFTFDPQAGSDWAARFSLAGNPQPEADWPTHRLAYQDADSQAVAVERAFTLADFAAADSRYGNRFAATPREAPSLDLGLCDAGDFIAGAERADGERPEHIDSVPALLMAAPDNSLRRVVVSEKIVREARRCLSAWRSLQELGGIHNSHAEQRLAREKTAWESSVAAIASAAAPAIATAATTEPAPGAAVAAAGGDAGGNAAKNDEAYIETPRCASCNECVRVNEAMFAYDDNKQAYIKDIAAGTYAQLVEAAENCQVAIIHPGKPRNADEPGLDELLKRAESFA